MYWVFSGHWSLTGISITVLGLQLMFIMESSYGAMLRVFVSQ